MNIPDVFGLKGIGITAALAFAAGTFGGGLAMNKFHWSKNAKAEIKSLKGRAAEKDKALTAERKLTAEAKADKTRLSGELSAAGSRIASLESLTVTLAAQRPRDTERIIIKGNEIAQNLDPVFSWVRNAWPDELRDYANGLDRGNTAMSTTSALQPASLSNEGSYP